MIFWNPNSVLFEVAMCVMFYLNVLYIEFLPIVAQRYKDRVNLPGPLSALNQPVQGLLRLADRILDKIMWVFIVAGVVLSCMHQSSLGSLMLIAPTKLHPLWYTPVLPLFFLVSAITVGYPMVVFETTRRHIVVKAGLGNENPDSLVENDHFSFGALPGAQGGGHGGAGHLGVFAGWKRGFQFLFDRTGFGGHRPLDHAAGSRPSPKPAPGCSRQPP